MNTADKESILKYAGWEFTDYQPDRGFLITKPDGDIVRSDLDDLCLLFQIVDEKDLKIVIDRSKKKTGMRTYVARIERRLLSEQTHFYGNSIVEALQDALLALAKKGE